MTRSRVAIVGVLGRMGGAVRQAVEQESDMVLVGGVERAGHSGNGEVCGDGKVVAGLAELVGKADMVVDFALEEGLGDRVRECADAGCAYICGVTGLGESTWQELRSAAGKVTVVHAPNFSIGVNLLVRLAGEVRKLLGVDYDVEVIDTHHRMKRDAPSGTAARLVEAIIEASEVSRVRNGRSGLVGAKDSGEVGVHSVRTGDVIGDHTVIFGGPGERVELTHRATSREAFARGVIAAIRFCRARSSGFYGMDDVLGGRVREP